MSDDKNIIHPIDKDDPLKTGKDELTNTGNEELVSILDNDKNKEGDSTLKEGNNTSQSSSETTITDLKNQLHGGTSIDEEHKKLTQHLAAKLGISQVFSLEELVQSPKFKDLTHELLDTEGLAEIEKGNKRPIDKFLFDRLNNIVDTKTSLYNYFMNDPIIHPQVMGDDSLDHIDEHYFDFDENNPQDISKFESLKQEFPRISLDPILPLNIQYVVLLAAQRYPELKNTKIHVQRVDGFKIMSSKQHVMRSQVNPLSLIKELAGIATPDEREYIIQVNVLDKDGVVVLPKVTQHSKGGVMVHEFAHSLDYSMKSAGKMAKFLAAFGISPRWVRGMERKTDETAIARGAGYGLYTFRKEVHGGSTNEYVDYKKRTYLGPKEILYGIVKHHTSYSQDILNKVIQHIINEDY